MEAVFAGRAEWDAGEGGSGRLSAGQGRRGGGGGWAEHGGRCGAQENREHTGAGDTDWGCRGPL